MSVLVIVPALSIPLLSSQATTDLAWGPFGFNLSHAVGVVLFLGFLALRARAVHPLVLWLGSISYALYLAHASVIEVVRRVEAPAAVAFPVVILASLLVAWVLHRVVEIPSIRLGRRLSGPRTGESARASVRP
ncbi:hypothetical protein [Curtobacterium sp. MCBA15_001]|uniref:hypothetical protein n=1 Tax=Curtobacterium sp. MCBA15_001 TaxID=1898731 RepID=UPI0009F37027|nr:hypothetical protein [Curtobacterium sp. MCBA15_001]